MKGKISKILAVLLSAVILFSQATPAMAALVEGNSYSYTTRYLDAYYSTGDWYTADGHMHNDYGQVALRNLKSNDEPLYCIQAYAECTGADATAKSIKSTNLWDNELTSVAQRGITRVSIYGYPNNSYGYSSTDAQLATQILIWEFETGIRQGYTAETTSFARNICSNYPNALKCYLEIVKACTAHSNKPSFDGTTVELKGVGESNAVTLTDTNGVLTNFSVKSSNSNVGLSASGNKLKVWAKTSGNLTATLTMTKKNTDTNSAFALVGANQTLFYGTIADPVTSTLNVKLATGNIKLVKTSEDGKVDGIKFRIVGDNYDKTFTTDKNGVINATDLQAGTYTVTEESIDRYLPQDPKTVTVTAGQTASVSFQNELIKGKIAIIKHTDNGDTQVETPEKGAEFQVYLKSAGSYDKADADERDTIVCDEDGFASTKLLPYGTYTVHQTKGWDGREMIADFDVFICEDGKTYKYLINNKNFESYLKVVKVDTETGKSIPYEGAAFQIYDSDGKLVTMQYTYPQVTSINTFTTNSEGYLITPEKLPYGDYTLVEVQAPYGYVLDSTPIAFTITQEDASTDTGVTVVKVKAKDMPQKGVIEITKTGEIFTTVNESESVYTPVYQNGGLDGAVFQIYAAEDITTLDGTVRYEQGELVDEITTDENGAAKSKELYLGKYTVVEKTAPHGYVNANEQYGVELAYAGQEVSVTSTALAVNNDRQKVAVLLAKELEQDDTFGIGSNGEFTSVQFGVYAADEITAADGKTIPADGLICLASCGKDGNISFDCDLPIDCNYYVKEVATDEHYVLSDTKYEFDTEYAGQDVKTIEIKINDGEAIENDLIYGSVKGYKTDRETGKAIEGVLFGIFKADETEYNEKNAILTAKTDKDGVFSFDNVPYGEWTVKEITPAEGYLANDEAYAVTIKSDGQVIELNIANDLIPELHTTATIDGKKGTDAKGDITITDTVSYKHLVPGKEYTLKGTLMDKSTGKEFTVNGKAVTSEVTFTPEKASGTVDVEFTFNSNAITMTTDLVVFESLYSDKIELATHADINDEGQTVTITRPKKSSPKTGADYTLFAAGIATMASAAGIMLIRRRRTRKVEK